MRPRFAELIMLLDKDPELDITKAIEALLLTESHIILRFEKYLHYPTKLWMLCERYCPVGYVANCQAFLEEDEARLAVGYSLKLRQEALETGDSLAAQLHFMVSDRVQAELCGIVEQASASSMQVERKHAVDKKNEKSKVVSVARASRNSILQRYRVLRSHFIKKRLSTAKTWKGQRFVNARSLAVKRAPELLPRPRGQLRSQPALSTRERAQIIHPGNPAVLQTYIEENRADLEREAAEIRKTAKERLQELKSSILPYTNREWLQWLDSNEAVFRENLREATMRRRNLSERLRQDQAMPAVPRLQPILNDPVCGQWGKILKQQQSGFMCISEEGCRAALVFWFCRVSSLLRAVACSQEARNSFSICLGPDFWKDLKPVATILREEGLSLQTQWNVDLLGVLLGDCLSKILSSLGITSLCALCL